MFIDHSDCAAQLLTKLYMDKVTADVVFTSPKERFPAHRAILAASYKYFHIMFYGKFSESTKKEIELTGDSKAFGIILKYIYTGQMPNITYEDGLVIETLKLAHLYGMEKLISALVEKLVDRIKRGNVIPIAICAQELDLKSMSEKCLECIDNYSMEIIRNESFCALPKELLCSIISRDEFSVNEIELLNAVMAWGEGRNEEDVKEALSHVRFTLMQINEVKSIVKLLGVLKSDEIVKVIEKIKSLDCLPYRKGNYHRNQLNCLTMTYLAEFGFCYRREWKPNHYSNYIKLMENGCIFQLDSEEQFNHIEMALLYKCSYYIEVSCDRREWIRIIDYSDCSCVGEQDLYFDLQPVRYIYVFIMDIDDSNKQILNQFKIGCKLCTLPKVDEDGVIAILTPQNQLKPINLNSNCIIHKAYSGISVTLSQPLYINCLWLKILSDHRIEVTSIKTALTNHSNFKEVKLKTDHVGQCYFFVAHCVNRMEIGFKANENNVKIQITGAAVFFNTTNMEKLVLADKD